MCPHDVHLLPRHSSLHHAQHHSWSLPTPLAKPNTQQPRCLGSPQDAGWKHNLTHGTYPVWLLTLTSLRVISGPDPRDGWHDP